MKKQVYRRPKGYNGPGLTTRRLSDLLPVVLHNIGEAYHERGDLVLAAWPEIIGSRLAVMTQAVAFESGFLIVKVNNSTLYSLLSQHDKPRILHSLRDKFPNTMIKNIVFRMG